MTSRAPLQLTEANSIATASALLPGSIEATGVPGRLQHLPVRRDVATATNTKRRALAEGIALRVALSFLSFALALALEALPGLKEGLLEVSAELLQGFSLLHHRGNLLQEDHLGFVVGGFPRSRSGPQKGLHHNRHHHLLHHHSTPTHTLEVVQIFAIPECLEHSLVHVVVQVLAQVLVEVA